ncbi:MAG TPA: histidine kinase, partial [Terriglobia bacterium]|nr:histidine kinase [Terriglobia bacterium]
GLRGVPPQKMPLPSLIKGTDGRLWFSGDADLTWLDPTEILSNNIPPRVTIDGIVAPGVRRSARGSVEVPSLSRNIRIDFHVTALRAQDQAKVFYRLQGVDMGWQDAGSRRQAFYTNLPSGQFRFQVRAYNENGTSSGPPAEQDFHVLPAYYETFWFRALVGLALVFLAVTAYVLRMRQVLGRLRIREDERMRIARDLHDTLLQSVHGLLFRVDTIKEATKDPWAREQAGQAAAQARAAMEEARVKVGELRAEWPQESDLVSEVTAHAKELSRGTTVDFFCRVEGEPRRLKAIALIEIRFLVKEMLTNAFRHSKASKIELTIDFDWRAFQARVVDDGRGFDKQVLDERAVEGHWGLRGLQERAHQLGGKFSLRNREGGGAEVAVSIPGVHVYALKLGHS